MRLINSSICLTYFALAFSGLKSHAEILWSDTQQALQATIDDKVVETNFDFENKGPGTVTITGIKTSCGCTTAEIDKKAYTVGQKGSVHVIYSVGNLMGLQAKSIAVSTDDARNPVYTLFLNIEVPEVLKLSTRYVVWDLGGKPEPQTIRLSAAPTRPIKVLAVTSDSLGINAKLIMEHEGTEYSILVTPTDMQTEARGTLIIETNLQQDGRNRKFYAYADIRPKATTQPPKPY